MGLYVAEYHVNTKYSIVLLDKLFQGYKVIWEVSFQFCHPIWLRRKVVNYSLVSAIYTDKITAMAHSLIKTKKNVYILLYIRKYLGVIWHQSKR